MSRPSFTCSRSGYVFETHEVIPVCSQGREPLFDADCAQTCAPGSGVAGSRRLGDRQLSDSWAACRLPFARGLTTPFPGKTPCPCTQTSGQKPGGTGCPSPPPPRSLHLGKHVIHFLPKTRESLSTCPVWVHLVSPDTALESYRHPLALL